MDQKKPKKGPKGPQGTGGNSLSGHDDDYTKPSAIREMTLRAGVDLTCFKLHCTTTQLKLTLRAILIALALSFFFYWRYVPLQARTHMWMAEKRHAASASSDEDAMRKAMSHLQPDNKRNNIILC